MTSKRNPPAKPPELDDPEWLRARYIDDGLTAQAIADLVGVTKLPVLTRLRRYGIPVRASARVRRALVGVEDRVVAEYQSGDSLATLAERYGVSTGPIVDLLEREGVPRRSTAPLTPRRSKAWPTLMQDGWLEDQYVNQRKSINIIAGQLGCTIMTVQKAMRHFGIPVRRPSPLARPTAARKLSHRHILQVRDGYTGCALCGSEKYPEVHHRDGDRSNNTPENLIVLCKDCHAIAEWFIRPVEMRLRGRPQLTLAA